MSKRCNIENKISTALVYEKFFRPTHNYMDVITNDVFSINLDVLIYSLVNLSSFRYKCVYLLACEPTWFHEPCLTGHGYNSLLVDS